MTKVSAWRMAGALLLLCAATAIAAQGQTFNLLPSFDRPDGAGPLNVSLTQGRDGTFYGTTAGGGAHGMGSVFKVSPEGNVTTIYSFCPAMPCPDGSAPYAGLLQASDGNFYGTTFEGGQGRNCGGGCGTVFRVTTAGVLTTLYKFCQQTNCADGGAPMSGLVQGVDGNMYGTTEFGGTSNASAGTVFRVDTSGNLTTLHSFCLQQNCPDGDMPQANLILATDGNFYGTTLVGGTGCDGGCGTIYKLTPEGQFTTLYRFNDDEINGADPGALIQASDQVFYGTTEGGGTHNGGTIFRITRGGTLTTLYSFCEEDFPCIDNPSGSSPVAGLIQATDGNLYGTTFFGGDLQCNGGYGCGTIFELSTTGRLATLHQFDGSDGLDVSDGLLQATNGVLYGLAREGGRYSFGTVYSLDMGLGPFVTFVRAAGKVGQTGGILGQGFTGTTSVSLNGIPASFTVVSDTFIKATVPAGATTGYVTVTTPSGTLTSNVPFHVIP